MDGDALRAAVRAAAMRFDPAAYARAQQRVNSAPLEMTEHDFDQLALVSGVLEADARAALREAQLAIVRANQAPPIATKSAPPAAPDTIETWLQRHGKKSVTWSGLMGLLDTSQRWIPLSRLRAHGLSLSRTHSTCWTADAEAVPKCRRKRREH
jgi:hypothetical protein